MAESIKKLMVAECLECGYEIVFHEPARLGQVVVCSRCHERFEVCWLSPLELDWAEDETEDYGDDDDDWF